MKAKLLGAAIASAIFAVLTTATTSQASPVDLLELNTPNGTVGTWTESNVSGDFVYTYTSSILNPLFGLPPDNGTMADYISISFGAPLALLPNSTYNISVEPGSTQIASWGASDTRFGITLMGVDAPISLVPAPGLINGGALFACEAAPTLPCFGGAIQTGENGNPVQWNLVADGAENAPYLTFITYDTTSLGSIDGLGSTQNFPTQTPLPAALSLFAGGLGVLGLFGWRRKRKAQAVAA